MIIGSRRGGNDGKNVKWKKGGEEQTTTLCHLRKANHPYLDPEIEVGELGWGGGSKTRLPGYFRIFVGNFGGDSGGIFVGIFSM